VSVIVFGSFARGAADAASDVDIVVVRSDAVDPDDVAWSDTLELWRRQVAAITGNDVELVEVSLSEAARKLRGRSDLWRDVRRDGVVVFGMGVEALSAGADVELSA
jgi:predicted nucleotidyltransferase